MDKERPTPLWEHNAGSNCRALSKTGKSSAHWFPHCMFFCHCFTFVFVFLNVTYDRNETVNVPKTICVDSGLERNLKYDRSQFSIRRARWPEFLRTDGYNELISHTAPAHIIQFLMMEQLSVLSILSRFSLRCRTCMFPPRVTHNYLIYSLSEQILSARNEC